MGQPRQRPKIRRRPHRTKRSGTSWTDRQTRSLLPRNCIKAPPLMPMKEQNFPGGVYQNLKNIMVIPTTLFVLIMLSAFPAVFATQARPFKGDISGNSIALSQTSNSITATVYLTHLGNSHLIGTTTVTGQSECGGFVGTEKDTITSPNGDGIRLSGHGVSCPTSPTVFQDNVTFTVTGGTGRFSTASGSGTIHTTIVITSLTTATFTATITGTISY